MRYAFQTLVDNLERADSRRLLQILCIAAAIISVIRSIIAYKYFLINDDGILYLRAAELIAHGKWSDALAQYPWPAYPAVIAGISKITGFDYEISSQIIAAVSSASLGILVLLIVRGCSPDNLILSCAFLLLIANPVLNQTRAGVLREQPFIIFIAASIFFYLKYVDGRAKINFILFCLCCAVASLFRAEGAAFMCLIPLVDRLISSNSLAERAIALTLLCLFFAIAPYGITWFGRSISFGLITARVSILRHLAELPLSTDRSRVAYGGVVVGLVLFGTISAIGLPSLVYLAFGSRCRFEGINPRVIWALTSVVVASILIGLFQVTFSLYYDGRHAMPATIATIPLAAVGYASIARWWIASSLPATVRAILLVLAVALLAYGVSIGVPRLDESQYQVAAGKWIEAEVPAHARVLSNNNQVLYYAHRPVLDSVFLENMANFWVAAERSSQDFAKLRDWSQWDFVALALNSDQLAFVDLFARAMNGTVVQRFTNSRADQVVILRIQH